MLQEYLGVSGAQGLSKKLMGLSSQKFAEFSHEGFDNLRGSKKSSAAREINVYVSLYTLSQNVCQKDEILIGFDVKEVAKILVDLFSDSPERSVTFWPSDHETAGGARHSTPPMGTQQIGACVSTASPVRRWTVHARGSTRFPTNVVAVPIYL